MQKFLILKNYFYLLLWTVYFVFSFLNKNNINNYLEKNLAWYENIIVFINALIGIIIVISLFNILENYLLRIIQKLISGKFTKKAENSLLDFIKKIYNITKIWFWFFIFLQFFDGDIIDSALRGKITLALIVYLIIYVTSWITKILLEKRFQTTVKSKTPDASIIKFVNKLIIIGFWFVGIAFLLVKFWYNVSTLVAWAWIGWLAIALAAQKSITNIFWAITIILNKPFYIGDYININGQEGRVRDIGLTYLTIIDRMWHRVMIPNETIITSSIANFSVRENRRTEYTIWIVYGTSLEKVKEWVELIKNILQVYFKNGTISDDIRVNFELFNAYSLDINVTFFSLVDELNDYLAQKQSINLEIKEAFENAWIEMAFPTQELIVKEWTFPTKKK